MKYLYSESLGMQSVPIDKVPKNGTWSDTEEEAYLYFYVKQRNTRMKNIDSLKNSVANIENYLKELDEKFGYLKEKYAEEFL